MRYHDDEIGRDAPQNWEALARRSPAKWDRFTRADGLERWTAEQDDALERDVAETTRRIQGLDQGLRPIALAALGANPSPAWRTILGALVVAAWDSARRMSGQRDACVGQVLETHRAPFPNLTAALEYAIYRQPVLGVASRSPVILRDHPRDVAARMSARAAGVDVRQPRTTFTGSGRARGAAAVELRIDVLRAIRRSGVTALDLWLVVASDVGELQPRARRTKTGIEEALQRRSAGQLAAKLKEAGVDLEPAGVRVRAHATRERLRAELEARDLIPRPPRLTLIHGPALPELPTAKGAS
jgi:hypothetical protein